MIMALIKITCLSFLFSPHLVSASTALWLLNPLAVFRVNFVMTNLPCLQLTALTVVLSSVFVLYQFLLGFQTSVGSAPGCPCGYLFFPFSIVFLESCLLKAASLTGCRGCQGLSTIYTVCLAKALFFPAVDQGIVLFLSLTLMLITFSV